MLTARTAAMVQPFEKPLEQLSRVALAKEPLACGSFVGISGAQWCFVVTRATDAPRRDWENINGNKAP